MILNSLNVADNFVVMNWGISKTVIVLTAAFLFFLNPAWAYEKIGIITDTILTKPNYYNTYYRTPEFFLQDVRSALNKKGVQSPPVDIIQNNLKKSGLRQGDFEGLQMLSTGYNLHYPLLKKIAKSIGVNKLVVITMGIDTQRDFLKNTVWNIFNVPGYDVVNPTHRVSVYVAFVDVKNEIVLWETIYAKNIRNNKMKNLDTTVSGNYEGMLRLKEYSKYISPDIAYNVKMKMLNENFVEPPTEITKENLVQYAKDKHNIGVKKELSEIERQKWDSEKLINDTKENIKEFTDNTKTTVKKGFNKTKEGAKNTKNKVFNKINPKNKTKRFKKDTIF